MGFEFKSDQEPKQLVDSKTTLSVNNNVEVVSENDLTQPILTESEEGRLAIEFLEENGLYQKFLLWQGIKEQLKTLKDSLAIQEE